MYQGNYSEEQLKQKQFVYSEYQKKVEYHQVSQVLIYSTYLLIMGLLLLIYSVIDSSVGEFQLYKSGAIMFAGVCGLVIGACIKDKNIRQIRNYKLLVVVLWLAMACVQIYIEQDMLKGENQNMGDYFFNKGIGVTIFLFLSIQMVQTWKLQAFILLSSLSIFLFLMEKKEDTNFWINNFIKIVLSFLIIRSFYFKDIILKDFLNSFQNKLKDQHTWFEIVDEFQDGFILLKKNHQTHYQNKAVKQFFGKKTLILNQITLITLNFFKFIEPEDFQCVEFSLRKAVDFVSVNQLLRFIMSKMQMITGSNQDLFTQFKVKLQILNFKRKKVTLDLFFRTKMILNQQCFIIYCYNKNFQQKLDEAQALMIASISHDLRTPLNGIITTLQAIELPKYPKEFKVKYDVLTNSSDYLQCLVEDILVHKQITLNQQLSMVYENVDLRETVEVIINLMKQKAKKREIALVSQIHPDVPELFNTEPRRLKQILFNLVGNAIKFTFDGYVKIYAKVVEHGNNKLVQIEVKDTGIGIKEENLKKVFKMFQMIKTEEGNKSGIGLGLFISKQLSKELTYEGGEGIMVTSKISQGTTFSLLLENKENYNDTAEYQGLNDRHKNPRRTKIPKKSCQHPKVLLVDDDENNIFALNLLLKKFGYKSDSANNGETAIQLVKARDSFKSCSCVYKLIIMDCNMPKMNGYQACNILKNLMKEGKLKKVVIVAYTADISEDNVQKCKESQFDCMYVKPFQKGKFEQILNKYLI